MPNRIRKLFKNLNGRPSGADASEGRKGHAWVYRENVGQDFTAERSLLRIAFPYALIIGGAGLLLSIYRTSTRGGWQPMLVWHVTEYLLAAAAFVWSRRFSPWTSFYALLGILLTDVAVSLSFLGLASSGLFSLLAVSALAGVFIGKRAGLACFAAGALIACLAGLGYWTGRFVVRPDIQSYLSNPLTWIMHLVLVGMYAVPLVLGSGGMHEKVASTVDELIETNKRLRGEMSMRRLAEADLRRSEEKYRNIFERAVEGIFVVSPTIEWQSVNPALARAAGFATPEELMADWNTNGPPFVDPEDRMALRKVLEEQGGVAEAMEFRVYTKNREVRWISLSMRGIHDEQGRLTGYEGTAEDVTKRKEAEAALRESALQYRNVVESSLVALCVVQNGRFSFVNKKFCDVLGYSAEEIVDRTNPLDLVHPDYKDVLRKDKKTRIAGGDDVFEIELKAVRKDKGVVTLKVFTCSTESGGQTTHLVTFIDVTQERMLESKLRQAQKMEAIGTLAGGIAHDFNNILTVLTGYGSLLKMRLEATDPLCQYVDQMLLASSKATSLTQSLLAFGRLQPISLKPADVNAIVRGTEKLLRRLITEDINLKTFFGREEIIAMADSTQIDQILFNLATNARDAMPNGGTLTIATGLVEMGEDFIISHGFGEVGKYALLSFSDTGAGMDERTKERIFDPFFTTKEAGKGTGLGLSTVYGIVKRHGGYITVWSEPGLGTSFRIYLPVVKAAPVEAPTPALNVVHGTAKLLVADDDEEVRRLIKDMLSYCGYEVVEAADGEEAVSLFATNEDIALVILDLVMPVKSGREAYVAMKNARSETRALFMSGHTRELILDKGITDSDTDFIQKPFPPAQLLERVQKMLAR